MLIECNPSCFGQGHECLSMLPTPSLLPFCSHGPSHSDLPALPRAHQAHSYLRAFARRSSMPGCFSPGHPRGSACFMQLPTQVRSHQKSLPRPPVLAALHLCLCVPAPRLSNPGGTDSITQAPWPSGLWSGSANGRHWHVLERREEWSLAL